MICFYLLDLAMDEKMMLECSGNWIKIESNDRE
jgi:hypothetical protein